jgi:hypothetical protein
MLQRVAEETVLGTMSAATEKWAEEFAKEAMKDEKLRKAIKVAASRAGQAILDRFAREDARKARRRNPRKKRR